MASVFMLLFSIFIQNCITQKSPTISYISLNQIKDIGATVELTCALNDAGDYAVIWRKSDPKINENNVTFSTGSTLVVKDDRLSVRHDALLAAYTLQIRDIEVSDDGTYYCEVPRFPQVSASVELHVNRPPIILDNSTKSTIAVEGEDVRLECSADGYPIPTITWRHQNKETLRIGGVIYRGNVLLIESIGKEDRGTYYCVADNKVDRAIRRNVEVTVAFAPVVTVWTSTVSQALEYDKDLVCHVEAYPLPAIIWLKNNVPLSLGSQHHSISNFSTDDDVVDSILRINSVEKTQYGKYVCKATNKFGSAEGEVELLESKKLVCASFCDEDIFTEDNNTTLQTNTTLKSGFN